MTPTGKRGSYLTGKGGVGLVTFHLARMRVEFAVTSDHCPFGDIWIDVDGRKFGIEVKTSGHGQYWHINRNQTKAADFYCLVDMRDAKCYVLTSVDLEVLLGRLIHRSPKLAVISRKDLSESWVNAWHIIAGTTDDPVRLFSPRRIKGKKPRKVTHTLKNGEKVTYEYPAYQARF